MKHTNRTTKRAFTLIELLIVIAIIGILFVVLISRVDFATDKAKASGVQTDFRSFQVAFETVSKENAGFASLGWDTGDENGNHKRDSYDEGDTNKNSIMESTETWTGHKVPGETWTGTYTLLNPKKVDDTSAFKLLEDKVNANLDPKLHITITPDVGEDGKLTGNAKVAMANSARDPWKNEYHGVYLTNAQNDKSDRGAFIIYSNGANGQWGSEHSIANGKVTIIVPGNNVRGKDDMSIVSCYTYVNGYGEVNNITTGFSNNQSFLSGGNNSNPGITDTPDNGGTPPVEDNNNEESTNLNQYVWTIVDDEAMSIVFNEQGGLDVYYNFAYNTTIPSQCISVSDNIIVITGTGDFDGEYTVHSNGNLTMNGYLVATARLSLFDENGNFRYMNIKFDAAGGYIIANENGLSIYNRDDILEYRIPLSSIDLNPVCVTATDADGTAYIYYDRNGTRMLGVSLEYAETYVIGFLPGYCDHRGIDNSLWYNWYDADMNCISTNSFPTLDELQTYTLRCDTCFAVIPTRIIGNYIYMYNAFMEPWVLNGQIPQPGGTMPSADINYIDIDGWFALAYDSAVVDGLLDVVDGKPVTAVGAGREAILPATTILYYDYAGTSGVSVPEYTFLGTMEQFRAVKANWYNDNTFVEERQWSINYGRHDKVIIHCSDGDIVIE